MDNMVSVSHWGMFECAPWFFIVPEGFELSEHDKVEWLRPDGYIELRRK